MDVAMPKLSGVAATQQIKKLQPSVVVLVLTGYDYDEYILSLLEAGAAGYLLKNVTGEELINAIRAVYTGELVLHPVVLKKVMTRLKPWLFSIAFQRSVRLQHRPGVNP